MSETGRYGSTSRWQAKARGTLQRGPAGPAHFGQVARHVTGPGGGGTRQAVR